MSFELCTSSSKKLKDVNVECVSANISETYFKNKLRVLVVDDSKINRMILSTQLGKLGVETQEAENGKEAVEMFLKGSDVDLILMDKDMPIMDGPEATRTLRSMDVLTKIVGLTANSTSEAKEEFLSAGINKFYTKPINLVDLIKLLREVDEEH